MSKRRMENKEIIDQVEKLRKRFKTELEDDPLATEMSFIDEVDLLVKKVFKDSSMDAYSALSEPNLEEWKRRRSKWWRNLGRYLSPSKIGMFALMVTIIGFLVSEAVGFYAIDGVITPKTWLKAILMEVCFIFVSAYRANGWFFSGLAVAARVGVFVLMMFVISSEVTIKGLNQVNEVDVIQEKIELVEEQIKEKEKLIDFYIERKWPMNAKKVQDEKQGLVEELLKLKSEQIAGKNKSTAEVTIYKTWAQGAFRVMLLFINVLIARRLFKL